MISIIQTPSSPLRSFTPTLFRVVSDAASVERIQAAYAGFIGNTGTTTQQSILLSAQVDIGSTGAFTFDMQEFVRDNLYYDIQAPAAPTDAIAANNSIFRIVAQQYTELLNVNGQLTNGATLTNTTDTFLFLNATRQVTDPDTLLPFIINPSVAGFEKFLTNSPRTIEIREGDSYVLSVYSAVADPNAIGVFFRDATGAQIGAAELIDFTSTLSGRYDIPVGLANLIAKGISIPNGTAYYTVTVGIKSFFIFVPVSETFTFRIVGGCLKDSLRVHFLNKLGGFDSFTFTDVTKESVSTTSSQYEKNLGNTFNQQSRGRNTQYRSAIKTYVATSEILSRAKAQWLTELVTTAVAYLEIDGLLYSATINDGRFLTFDPNKLTQLTMTFTLSNDIRNQRL